MLQKNEFGKTPLNERAVELLQKLSNFLNAKGYSLRTVRNYVQEVRFLFVYYNLLLPDLFIKDHIIDYLNFIKKEHGVGRDKCRMAASSFSFFFKHILVIPNLVPEAFYPRKEFHIPEILAVEQMTQLWKGQKRSFYTSAQIYFTAFG